MDAPAVFPDAARRLFGMNDDINGLSGLFQVDLAPFGRLSDNEENRFSGSSTTNASTRALAFSSWADGWPGAVYMPSAIPVSSAAPRFSDGELAGEAACAAGEQGILPYTEAKAALVGECTRCSGDLKGGVARVHFAETDVDLYAADGSVIAHQHYEPQPEEGPYVNVLLGSGGDPRQWLVVMSRYPRKISVSEATGDVPDTAVFSAIP